MRKLIKNYRLNDNLRASFNRLAEKVFGLNFESWYQNGYWQDKYIPYSIVEDDEVIANVSVNITDMMWNGEVKHLIQLGTVMTEEKYRNQGLIRLIMEEIDEDFGQKVDGIYLFANDSVLDFYPKFGFKTSDEYQYSKEIDIKQGCTVKQLPMYEKKARMPLEQAINNNKFKCEMNMTNNLGLYMFYISGFMQENVYYEEKLNAYIIAEIEESSLFIHNVFSENDLELEDIIKSFGEGIKEVTLGFAPLNKEGYNIKMCKEEDTTLFVKGHIFDDFDKEKIMFPTLAHA